MAVRPFYVRGRIDGRKTEIGAGPGSKDGGMELEILQRDSGKPRVAFRVSCRVVPGTSNRLEVSVEDFAGREVAVSQSTY